MDDVRVTERILDRVRDWFFAEGLNGFTMDDVARENGVSKKTLYRLIPSKTDLIRKVFERQIDQVGKEQDRILSDESLGYRQKLDAMLKTVVGILSRIRRKTVEDMARIHPDLWEYARKRRLELIRKMTSVLKEGQDVGEIRSDVPVSFISRYFESVVDELVTPRVVIELDMSPGDLMDNALKLFFDGVGDSAATAKGRDR